MAEIQIESDLPPLLVSVKQARRLLGGIGNGLFWKLVKRGEFELVGTERKRWVVVASLNAYVERATTNMASASESPSHIVQRRRAMGSEAAS